MSKFDDEQEYGVPFWAYSDDEDLDDVRVDSGSTVSDEPLPGPREVLGLSDEEEAEAAFHAEWAAAPPSRESVKRMLDRPQLSWTYCQRAIADAAALSAWDLVEDAAVRALQIAHDGNYTGTRSLGQAARHVLAAKCATVTLDELPKALHGAQARLRPVRDLALRDGRAVLGDAVDGEICRADEMLLLLTSADDTRALAQLAGGLRHLGTPHLAIEAATRAIDIDPLNPAPWVVRAASLADQRNHRDALVDLDQDVLAGNVHAAVTRSRVYRTVGRMRDGLEVALGAARQQPSKITLTMLTVLATDTGDQDALVEAERLYALMQNAPQDRPASRLLGLLAAQWLANEGDHQQALQLAETVATEGPPWQQADRLVARLRRQAA